MLTYTHTHKHRQYIPVCVHANKELGLKILNNLENLVFIQYVQSELYKEWSVRMNAIH